MENNTPSAAPNAKAKQSKKFRLILLSALILGVLTTLWLLLNPSVSTDNAMVERRKATISTKMMGVIAKINVKEGDLPKAGDVLVEVDTAELQAQKKQAEANLIVVQQGTRLSQVAFDRVQSDYNRAQSQYAGKIISTEAFDHAQKAWESAQVDFTLAQKKVEVAQAQLDLINATIANATLTARFDAVVAKKWLGEGDVLQPGQPVLTLYDRHEATVTANFEETRIPSLKIGQKVEIKIDAYPGVTFHGSIFEIGSNTGNQFSLIPVNNAAGNFTKVTQRVPVKIKFDGSTDLTDTTVQKLLPGMSAVVEVKF